MNEVTPNTVLIVKLEVQQWNLVLAGVSELKIKDALVLWQILTEQLQGQTTATVPVGNGVDAHPPAEFATGDPLPA